MDKQQAKFILQSFRPDGADATDEDFAQALQLATQDRELGEWLAEERAADAIFAAALSEIEIPDALRREVLDMMRGIQPDDLEIETEEDRLLCHALGDIQPPVGLRDQIVAAMEMESAGAVPMSSVQKKKSWFPKVVGLAAALVLGGFLAVQMTGTQGGDRRLTSHEVQQQAGNLLNVNLELDVKDTHPSHLNTWLVSHELPAPRSLPRKLRGLKSIGCKQITLPGDKKASMLCFLRDGGGAVHLVVIRNKDVSDTDLPTIDEVSEDDCYHCPKTNWDVVRWRDEQNTYVLLSRKEGEGKNEILEYF